MSSLSLFAFVSILLAAPACFAFSDRPVGRPFATRSEVFAPHGMAATSQPLATQVAIDILKAGGSAVDAAIAANAALGLMEPTGSGIGGDLFAIVWDPKTRKLHGLNASGPAPRRMTRALFADRGLQRIPDYGPLSISVPGCVDGWRALHERFGKLPLSAALAPAVRYARDGFPLSEVIAHHWAAGARVLRDYPGFPETFLIDGAAPGKGDMFRNPALADTLERIGANGPREFYEGDIAQRISAFCAENDCPLRAEDLAAYRAEWVDPVSITFLGHEVWELPPNGQGIAALQMLNMLERFDLKAMGHNSAAYLHHLVEAKKIAFEDRARWYADPAFVQLPIAELISKPYAAERAKLINPQRAATRISPGDPRASAQADAEARLRDGDTIYLAVADADGMMVSLIQSNYRGFGSGLCPTGLGFCLQDRASLFTLDADHPNALEPGKRPFHTIIPGFVTRAGEPLLAFGVMGGDMQPQGHVQVLLNLLVFEMNLQEAGDAARFHHVGSSEPTGEVMSDGGELGLESGISSEARAQLKAWGHTLTDKGYFGGYQAIMRDPRGFWVGASESRKDGGAGGY